MNRKRVTAKKSGTVRYAVVGLGHIAQTAVLPAFAHAAHNSRLAALVSNDPIKLKQLGKQYDVSHQYSYRQYDQCLEEGEIDAVYIALPNSLHCDFAVRAAQAGIHVLCEKPMAVTEQECRRMISAAEYTGVKLMVAYRLHFEAANMSTVKLAQSGRLGGLRLFDSLFTMQVRPGDIRVQAKLGGGSLYDIGVYCINAARYIFQANPIEASASIVRGTDARFREVDEMAAVWLRFPDDRLATFICSFGAADVSTYEVIGTKGRVRLNSAFEYVGELEQQVVLNGKTQSRAYKAGDQFAPELLHFSDGILRNTQPEPSGWEGLIDVSIVQALYRSAQIGRPVPLSLPDKKKWPSADQIVRRPPVTKTKVINVQSPFL
ncbi:MAG: Gfo/Idh/MocA family oxidoreductase [Nitrospira sp.]|nr:Gfo/Idh/MocA family oxidoreductase [Nitrospira sp.]